VVIQADASRWKKALMDRSVRIFFNDGQEEPFPRGDPSDKSDRDILEAVIGLEGNPLSLPIGP